MKDKINKLLALAKSANVHEAEAAMAKAQALMQEHQLSHLDLIPDPDVSHTDLLELTQQHYIWARTLATAAAMMFDCQTIRYPQDKSFRFIGEKDNLQHAQLLFWHLFKAWKTICNIDYKADKPIDRKNYRKSHGLGYANSLYHKAFQLTEERKQNITKSAGTDLIVIHTAKVDEYMKSTFNTKTVKNRQLKVADEGYEKGHDAGTKMNLVAPLTKKEYLLK